MSAPTDSTSFDFRYLVKGWLMRSILCPNGIIQMTLCFLVTIAFHTSPINHSVKYVAMNGMCKLMHIHTSQWTCTRHIFRFSWWLMWNIIDNIRIPWRSWDEWPLSMNARLMRGKVKGKCSVSVVISSILLENAEASLLCLQLYQLRGKEKGPSQIPRSFKCYDGTHTASTASTAVKW